MELSENEIKKIEKYLDKKEVFYIDFRIEILDHIATEIENRMLSGEDFEFAFKKIEKKWNLQLEKTFSWMFGTIISAPKIVLKEAKRKFLLPYLLIAFLSISIIINIAIKENFELYLLLSKIPFSFITSFLIAICAVVSYKILNDRHKTVYSFIVKTQLIGTIISPCILFFGQLNSIVSLLFFLLIVVYTCSFINFYFKHKLEKKKYKILE